MVSCVLYGSTAPITFKNIHHYGSINIDRISPLGPSIIYTSSPYLPELPLHLARRKSANYYQPALVREFDQLNTSPLPTPTHDILPLTNDPAPVSQTVAYRDRAYTLYALIEEQQRYVDVIDARTVLQLPVGLKKTIGNLDYTILIDSMILTPTYAYLTAYMSFEIPQNGERLAFRGTHIRFSKTGGLEGTARLQLIGDHTLNMGPKTLMTLKGDGTTYVDWNCNGFTHMGIGAEIAFSRDLLLPDTLTVTTGTDRVKAHFRTTLNHWNDLIAEVTIDPFQIKALKGVGFTVHKAIIDYSDQRNPPSLKFPDGYQSALITADNPYLWQGFYLQEIAVRLPDQFKKKARLQGRIEFAAYDVLIDPMGFSGTLSVNNLIQLTEGHLNGWAYSIDQFAIDIQANQLVSGGFGGDITVPITQKDQTFAYNAFIHPGNAYVFNISSTGAVAFPLWQAKQVELYPASYLEVMVQNEKFLPKANLHGKMSINVDQEKLQLANLEFQGLEVQTIQPYVQIQALSFGIKGKKQKMGDFSLAINHLGVSSPNEDELALQMNVTVNLVGEGEGGFGGKAGLSLVGKVVEDNHSQQWRYDHLDIGEFGVNVHTGAVKIQGRLAWFKKDIIYGDGIRGDVQLEIINKIQVQAMALFGTVHDTRYWFADALASLPPGMGTGIQMTRFGGGASYHMKQTHQDGNSLGQSPSGLVYLPDKNEGLAVKATVDMATAGSEKVFNGDATLAISFNKGSGIKKVSLSGNGYFMTPALETSMAVLRERAGKLVHNVSNAPVNFLEPKAQVAARVEISYDVPQQTFHGNFEVYVNVAAGIMRGVGSRNQAGWAVIHFSPESWYVHVGNPENPIGVQILKVIKTETYFMAGDYIPGSPPPPENVAEILGGIDLNYMASLNELESGRGVAFGSRFGMDTGDLNFLMFYARFAAGMGFDVMVKDYGGSHCVGREGPIGINGWYANGQAFAYFEGEIGIKVKVFGEQRQYEILNIGAAAVLQAKMPNPFWMQGIVGGKFSILGGMVKGNCRFEVTLGETCQLTEGSALEGIAVISEVTPSPDEHEVSVFNAAQGVFNMEVGKVFDMVDANEQKKSFRIRLDHFKVMNGTAAIPGKVEWNDDHTVAAFHTTDILPPLKELRASIQVSFEEEKNGIWKPVVVRGKKITEKKESTFTTSEAPDYIPLSNVAYSYPLINQLNFYQNESRKGYIQLKKGQPYLFNISGEWKQKGRFRSKDGHIKTFDFHYSHQQVSFTIPTGLQKDQIYAFELVNIPVVEKEAIDANVNSVSTKVKAEDTSIDAEIKTNQAEGSLTVLQEKPIFTTYIRTSRYHTLNDKLNKASLSPGIRTYLRPAVHYLVQHINSDEYFDQPELNGNPKQNIKPLIQLKADLSENRYYQDIIYPLVYEGYPMVQDATINWRDTQRLGIVPVKAVYIRQVTGDTRFTENDLAIRSITDTVHQASFLYNLIHHYERDYHQIQNKVAAYYAAEKGVPNERERKLLMHPFPKMTGGKYNFNITYVLPGTEQKTSIKVMTIHNPFE